jgi:transcriptional regulator with XRE-family HTH domain
MEASRDPVGRNVAALRKKAGFSQEELAFRADVHRTEVSLIERGKRDPRLGTLVKLARALGVAPETLITGVPRPEDQRRKATTQF